jgi:hypothetical protein
MPRMLTLLAVMLAVLTSAGAGNASSTASADASPTAGEIVFRTVGSSRGKVSQTLYAVRPNGTGLRKLFSSARPEVVVDVARNGTRLALVAGGIDGRVFTSDLRDRNRRLIGNGSHAALSPDGKQIVWSGTDESCTYRIPGAVLFCGVLNIARWDGSNRRTLFRGRAQPLAWWSADGSQLAVVTNQNQLTFMTPGGRKLGTPITLPSTDSDGVLRIAWHRQTLFLTYGYGSQALLRVNRQERSWTEIRWPGFTSDDLLYGYRGPGIALSPDGRLLAFEVAGKIGVSAVAALSRAEAKEKPTLVYRTSRPVSVVGWTTRRAG